MHAERLELDGQRAVQFLVDEPEIGIDVDFGPPEEVALLRASKIPILVEHDRGPAYRAQRRWVTAHECGRDGYRGTDYRLAGRRPSKPRASLVARGFPRLHVALDARPSVAGFDARVGPTIRPGGLR